ncbi:MAG: hypothetical protein J6Y29_05770 [Clostridiales bacterium]|nr:hypothetical protein [Clostridiales bacterium]
MTWHFFTCATKRKEDINGNFVFTDNVLEDGLTKIEVNKKDDIVWLSLRTDW